jgi:hypothetical protein
MIHAILTATSEGAVNKLGLARGKRVRWFSERVA